MLKSICELFEILIISAGIYLIYKLLKEEEHFTDQEKKQSEDLNEEVLEYEVIKLDYDKNPPNSDDLKKWIKQGFYLDDGEEGQYSPLHNKCSPLCCVRQKYAPEELQPKLSYDKDVAKELENYIPTNITCMDRSNLHYHFGNASCMCLPKKQAKLISRNGIIRSTCDN